MSRDKTDRKRDAAARKADKLRLTGAAVTVVLCGDEKEAGCASAAAMRESWKHLRKRAKALSRGGTRVAAVRTLCTDVCKFGPVAGVFPAGTWYGGCDPATLDRILDAHAGDGPDPAECRLSDDDPPHDPPA